jgi:secreted PhoX family phosphatase
MTYVIDDPDDRASNPSSAPTFAEVLSSRLSRRALVGGGLGGGLIGFLAPAAQAAPPAAPGSPVKGGSSTSLLGFAGVPVSKDDTFVVPEGYVAEVLIPWGTPILSTGPAWRKDASNTAAEQAEQVGMHHDGMHFFSTGKGPAGSARGLLVLNHEYVDPIMLYPEGPTPMTAEKVTKALHAHGVTVIAIEQAADGSWSQVDSEFNRRVHGNTPVDFSGPVGEDHPALAANGPARGTLNNCSMGHTPWGTYLACEENWNGYFGTTSATWTATAEQKRYGVDKVGFGYNWHLADPRFDIAANPNEIHRFGWSVEIDPQAPNSTPVKRTSLGRFKHEGALVTEYKGRVVVYSGDDQDKEYIYKFVGERPWRHERAQGNSPFDNGHLYVAKFHDDGTGEWLPLVHGEGALTVANGWADQADVLLRTRSAADAQGATPMDRPEWITENPRTGDVYCTLTNGSGQHNAANPRTPNPYGHIIRWQERRNDKTGTAFDWDLFVLAGDPAYDSRVTIKGDKYGSPDGLYFDADGRLWIQTDISNSSQNLASKGYDGIGNNMMLAADPRTGETRRFLTGPRGCEITGVVTTPDQRTMFVNVQHPGESTTAWGTPTPANPRAVSNWPEFDPAGRPRPSTVVIRRLDGGVIGA